MKSPSSAMGMLLLNLILLPPAGQCCVSATPSPPLVSAFAPQTEQGLEARTQVGWSQRCPPAQVILAGCVGHLGPRQP